MYIGLSYKLYDVVVDKEKVLDSKTGKYTDRYFETREWTYAGKIFILIVMASIFPFIFGLIAALKV